MTDLQGLEDYLLSRIEFDTTQRGCWLWTRSIGSHGYGDLQYKGEKGLAHRFAYRVWKGELPKDKPHVCHYCDTRPCIRPDHLFAGTDADNQDDKARKGRNGRRLKAADIPTIRARLAKGEIPRVIAADYGVHLNAIWYIKAGRTWKYL